MVFKIMENTVFTNARLIARDRVVSGELLISDGWIAGINDSGQNSFNGAVGSIDCEGDFLAPGMIELHTDNLERHLRPRPNVVQPEIDAVLAHDGELASVGITTVFDALRIGSLTADIRPGREPYAVAAAGALTELAAKNHLRIDHQIHLRCELCSQTLGDELDAMQDMQLVRIVSLMDHTPGQRQFRDPAKLDVFLKARHGMSDAEIKRHYGEMIELRALNADRHRDLALDFAKAVNAVVASHDDTTAADVDLAVKTGTRIAEFPTTMEAASLCHDNGISVMMGAPNLIRGGSHSGNVAAVDLVKHGFLHILSSDYVPASLLKSAVQFGQMMNDLAAGIASVTEIPARAAGLDDRGSLAVGLRGDLLRFAVIDGRPIIRGVWCAGRQVA